MPESLATALDQHFAAIMRLRTRSLESFVSRIDAMSEDFAAALVSLDAHRAGHSSTTIAPRSTLLHAAEVAKFMEAPNPPLVILGGGPSPAPRVHQQQRRRTPRRSLFASPTARLGSIAETIFSDDDGEYMEALRNGSGFQSEITLSEGHAPRMADQQHQHHETWREKVVALLTAKQQHHTQARIVNEEVRGHDRASISVPKLEVLVAVHDLERRGVAFAEVHARGLIEIAFWSAINLHAESTALCRAAMRLERELVELRAHLVAKSDRLRQVAAEKAELEREAERLLLLVESGAREQLPTSKSVPFEILRDLESHQRQAIESAAGEALIALAADVANGALRALVLRAGAMDTALDELGEASRALMQQLEFVSAGTATATAKASRQLLSMCESEEVACRRSVAAEEIGARGGMWSAWCSTRVQYRFLAVLADRDAEIAALRAQMAQVLADPSRAPMTPTVFAPSLEMHAVRDRGEERHPTAAGQPHPSSSDAMVVSMCLAIEDAERLRIVTAEKSARFEIAKKSVAATAARDR